MRICPACTDGEACFDFASDFELLASFFCHFFKRNKFNIDEEATILLSENIGNNLEKIDNALHKIFTNKDDKNIKTDDVIKLIGINREYNLFEFQEVP